MRLPQMTSRRWRTVVAVAAIVLGAGVSARRSHQLWRQEAAMARLEALALVDLSVAVAPRRGNAPQMLINPETAKVPASLVGLRKRALYYQRMRHEYERAARLPWLFLAPDPPMPGP